MKPDTAQIASDVKMALTEDLGSGDVTAELLKDDLIIEAEIISRKPMIVCGQPWVNAVFKQMSPAVQMNWFVAEGQNLSAASALCRIQGQARAVLSAERTALNFLQTLSATATHTHQYVQALEGTSARLLDTRKTIPGLRAAQKYAVVCGGGMNHRMGLYDAYLIKENHIKACGSIRQAIALARERRPDLFVEIEVENLVELSEALACKPDRILLDNFTIETLTMAVAMNQPRQCELEASGGVELSNIRAIAQTGVDFISVGVVTKSLKAIDLSLLIRS